MSAWPGAGAWVLCVISSAVFGSSGGRPPDPSLASFDQSFPVARVAATVAVAIVALPYLSRMVQLTMETAIGLLAVAAVVTGSGLPVAVLASLAVGWGVAALVHLVFGSPLGLPSSGEVVDLLAGLDIAAEDVAPRLATGVGSGAVRRPDRGHADRRLGLRAGCLRRPTPGQDHAVPLLPLVGTDPGADPDGSRSSTRPT